MTPRRRCCGRLPACLTPASVATSSLIQQRCALSTPRSEARSHAGCSAAETPSSSPGRYPSRSATTCLLGALAPDMPGCPGGTRSRSRQAPYATTAVPGTAGRARPAPQRPAAAAAGAQLLLAQRLDGSLTIGDTHAYDEPFAFDVDEAPYHHLRARAEQLLGSPLPPTRRRRAGVYSQVTGPGLYFRAQVAPAVVLITGPGGRGMTLAPGDRRADVRRERHCVIH